MALRPGLVPEQAPYPEGFLEACRALTEPTEPGDALTRYYLLGHPAAATKRHVELDPNAAAGPATAGGVIAVCRKIRRAEHPLVVFRAGRLDIIPRLLRAVLAPGQRHYFIFLPAYRKTLEACLADIGDRMETIILTLEAAKAGTRPTDPAVPNTLAGKPASGHGPNALRESPGLEYFVEEGGRPGYRLRLGSGPGEIVSSARTLWRFGDFAEMGVSTAAPYRRRGYAAAVAAALARDFLERNLVPLYVADKRNRPSLALAGKLGFVPSGAEECAFSGILRADADVLRPDAGASRSHDKQAG